MLFPVSFKLVPDVNGVKDELDEDQNEQDNAKSKRDDLIYQGDIYIEAMLAADKTTCDYYGNGTLDYLLNTANLVRVSFSLFEMMTVTH